MIVVDSPQRQSGKHKVGHDQPSLRPPKRQAFWVEVPPRPKKKKRVSSVPVKAEELAPEGAIRVTVSTTPVVKKEPDQEMADALAVISNVSWSPDSFLEYHEMILISPSLFCRQA